jgi:hypothetical protein
MSKQRNIRQRRQARHEQAREVRLTSAQCQHISSYLTRCGYDQAVNVVVHLRKGDLGVPALFNPATRRLVQGQRVAKFGTAVQLFAPLICK